MTEPQTNKVLLCRINGAATSMPSDCGTGQVIKRLQTEELGSIHEYLVSWLKQNTQYRWPHLA